MQTQINPDWHKEEASVQTFLEFCEFWEKYVRPAYFGFPEKSEICVLFATFDIELMKRKEEIAGPPSAHQDVLEDVIKSVKGFLMFFDAKNENLINGASITPNLGESTIQTQEFVKKE